MMICSILIFLIISAYCDETSPCSSKTSCNSCISTHYLCNWCSDEEFGDLRCGTSAELKSRQCKSVESEQPDMNPQGTIDTSHFYINPQTVTAKLLKHSSVDFDISVTKKQDFLFETVFVVDYSNTMRSTIDQIKTIIKGFIANKDRYKVSQIGIVRYIDKIGHPFSYTGSSSAGDPLYIEVLSRLTSNQQELTKILDESQLGSNADPPEASFDAVGETALCSDAIGWSTNKNVLKTIYMFTDEEIKFQGDGRPIGAILPHDLKCHIGPNGKVPNDGADFDYLSIGQVGHILRMNNIQLVMVVPSNLINYYQNIAKSWVGVRWLVVELTQNALDIGAILVSSNRDLNSNINLYYDKNLDVRIQVQSTCPDGAVKLNNYGCTGVVTDQVVRFRVTVQLLKSSSTKRMDLKISGVENVELNIEEIGECKCSKAIVTGKCNDHGSMSCGVCQCDPGFFGNRCQCNDNSVAQKKKCINPTSKQVCSNRGICDECGDCECRFAPDTLRYSGAQCQCSRDRCFKIDGEICGGKKHGSCQCDKCVCEPQYSGNRCDVKNCYHLEILKQCIEEGKTEKCSGQGECECGVCKCKINRDGKFCEKEISATCNDFEEAVNCYVQKYFHTTEKPCDIKNYVLDPYPGNAYICSIYHKNGCKLYYNFFEVDDEEWPILEIKEVDKKQDCPSRFNIFVLSAIIFGAILGVGLILLGLYIALTILYYRAEAKRLEIEVLNAKTVESINPLYEDPEQ